MAVESYCYKSCRGILKIHRVTTQSYQATNIYGKQAITFGDFELQRVYKNKFYERTRQQMAPNEQETFSQQTAKNESDVVPYKDYKIGNNRVTLRHYRMLSSHLIKLELKYT